MSHPRPQPIGPAAVPGRTRAPRRTAILPWLLALAVSPAAHATTYLTVDGHPAPITVTVGETVTLRFDVAKPGGNANFRLRRDLDHSGKYDPSLPLGLLLTAADGGQDSDPAPGKVAFTFTLDASIPAGPYVTEVEDITGGSTFAGPSWTIVPKPEAQAISGRVATVSETNPNGTVPRDAVIWAATDLQTLVASASLRADGSYTLPVPPGTYILFAEWFGNLRSQRQVVMLTAGQSVSNLNLALLQGQEVSGTVRDGAQPMADTLVQATADNGRAFSTKTLADGTYVLVLPSGKYRLTARGLAEPVTVTDQPVDGVDFPPPTPGPAPAAGTIVTIVGNGLFGSGGDGRRATAARLTNPQGVALDTAGSLYVGSNLTQSVRKVDSAGVITTVAGSGAVDLIRVLQALHDPGGFGGDDGLATAAKLNQPQHVTVDPAGNLYIACLANNRVRKVDVRGIITTVAGSGPVGLGNGKFGGDSGPAVAALLNAPQGVAVDAAGNLYIADGRNRRVRKVSPDGIITTIAGGGSNPVADGVNATTVALGSVPFGLTVDQEGNVFFTISNEGRVLKVSPAGILQIVAGTGKIGFAGDGGKATEAQLDTPRYLAVDRAGNLFIADQRNHRVRKVSPDGIIATVVGSGPTGVGSGGFSGDGGPATAARLNFVAGIAIDAAGNLLLVDGGNARVRKVIGIAAPGLVGGQ
jgi:sugar lactone lactonase YvrE